MKKHIWALILVLALNVFAEDAEEPKPEETLAEETPSAEVVKPETVKPEVVSAPAVAVSEKSPSASPWAWGIQFGQLRTNVNNAEVKGNSEKTSYTAGASLEYGFSEQWSLQTELNYMNKGWKTKFANYETNLKYLEIPLFLKIKFPWNNVTPSLMAGPWISYLHAATNVSEPVSLFSSNTTDITSSIKRFEYGVYIGAGLDLALSDELDMGVSARYGMGLSPVNDPSGLPGEGDDYNRVIQLLAHLKFRL